MYALSYYLQKIIIYGNNINMSADTLVYDMSSQSEGQPSIFVRKDWLSILDNQNQNYQGNQSVTDTSQLANSNKYMNYREAYFTIPLLLTLTQVPSAANNVAFAPATAATSADYALGLKNWYGSIVHSFTLDYNGATIIQQTPYIGLWNTFKLMTTLSLNDITTQGSSIGFYPDTASSFSYVAAANANANGYGTTNNNNASAFPSPAVTGAFNANTIANSGLVKRQMAWNLDPAGLAGGVGQTYGSLLGQGGTTQNNTLNQLWKSYIFNKVNATNAGQANATPGVFQVAITAQVYLKHLHSFFERVCLLKGVFMRLTMNFNQSSVTFTTTSGNQNPPQVATFTNVSVNSPLGGVNPIIVASGAASSGSFVALPAGTYTASLAVGAKILNSAQANLAGVQPSPLGVLY
jgi:hypothetical protein